MNRIILDGAQWTLDDGWLYCKTMDYAIESSQIIDQMQRDHTLIDHMVEKSWVDIADFIDCVHAYLRSVDREDLSVDRLKYSRKSFMNALRDKIDATQGAGGFIDLAPNNAPIDMTLTSNEIRDLLVCMSDANQHAGLDTEMQKLQQKLERVLKSRGETFA